MFLSEIFGFSCQYHSTVVLHTHVSPGGQTICPLVVTAVQRRSLIPSKCTISSTYLLVPIATLSCVLLPRLLYVFWYRNILGACGSENSLERLWSGAKVPACTNISEKHSVSILSLCCVTTQKNNTDNIAQYNVR
jgi:hypothetical protein